MTSMLFRSAFLRGHAILADLLRKAETHAAERTIAPSVLLTARLFPDMFTLTGQVQAACDTAKRATARLVGAEPPRFQDNEVTLDELHDRIRRTSAYVESHAADGFPGEEDRKIEMKTGSTVISLSPREYLTRFALPNFYFHITTAYDILRHNGVVLGKRDYLAMCPQLRSSASSSASDGCRFRNSIRGSDGGNRGSARNAAGHCGERVHACGQSRPPTRRPVS
jgi:uncharacterized protein